MRDQAHQMTEKERQEHWRRTAAELQGVQLPAQEEYQLKRYVWALLGSLAVGFIFGAAYGAWSL